MTFEPEINLARRLCVRLGLHPPINVEGLVKRYADLTEARFPVDVDVDGICLDLKIPDLFDEFIVTRIRDFLN